MCLYLSLNCIKKGPWTPEINKVSAQASWCYVWAAQDSNKVSMDWTKFICEEILSHSLSADNLNSRSGFDAVCGNQRWSLVIITTTTGSLLSLSTSILSSSEDGGGGSLNELLLGDTDHEWWDVDHLLSNGNVFLSNENTGVMDWLGEVSLLDQSLKSSLKELGGGQTEYIIELALVILQKSKSNHTSDEGLTYFIDILISVSLHLIIIFNIGRREKAQDWSNWVCKTKVTAHITGDRLSTASDIFTSNASMKELTTYLRRVFLDQFRP